MSPILTEQQKMTRDMARQFAEAEVSPRIADYDEAETFPWEIVKRMAELNLMGIAVPEEYSGAGLDTMSSVIVIEELGRISGSVAGILATHETAIEGILHYATKEQKVKYLPSLAKGDKIAAIAATEPNAGSDLASIETAAIKEGNNYRLNGTKIFISNGGDADIYLVLAKADKGKEVTKFNTFILEKGMSGFSFGQKFHKLSNRSCVAAELIFEDCIVSQENLVGEEGKGMRVTLSAIDSGRIGIGATCVGIGQGAFEAAVNYAKQRVQFGRPIAEFQGIQFMLADMATLIEAARLMVYNVAMLKDRNLAYAHEAAMAKLFTSDMAMKVTTDAVQIFGGYGLMKDYPAERYFRDAKQYQIVEGTNQIQRVIIGRNILR